MRTATQPPVSDLTARARIREAAITVFAEQGQAASLRTIAAAAGVSPALITHHFGSKAALKAECDEHVLRAYTEFELAGIADLASAMDIVNATDETRARPVAVISAYILRAFLDGGATARKFYGQFLARVGEIMTAAAAQGMVRPVCADEAHRDYLAASGLGFMLVQLLVDPPPAPIGFFSQVVARPGMLEAMLDVLTHGVFSDDQVLTAYQAARNQKEKS